ncbi:MAG: aspartate aminotransferase [Phycisphaerae bacterium SM23_33]|nr:MAG: aspartate aminotransferase [Phycisphaerae bacterium SM23_33]
MELSSRIKSVQPSATIAMDARAKQMKAQGLDVVDFGVGEPDFDTPDFIRAAAKAALDAGDTKYTPAAGAKLKAAIVQKLKRENALEYTTDQVLVTFGGKHALYNAFQVLLEPGRKVLIPAPYWVSYPEQVKLAGGEPIFLPTGPEKGFKITPQDLLARAGEARVLVLNNPSNPTGVTYTPQELKALAEAVLKTELIVFADEIYEKLIYGDTKFVSFASLDERLGERTLTFNGLSKTFSMTGWRLGWVAGPADVIKAMATLASQQTTNPVSFAQAGALAAYSDPAAAAEVEAMRREFERRGRRMWERLNAMEGVSCVQPTGAFYCFPDVSAHYGRKLGEAKVAGSMDFAAACLEQIHVAVVPGAAFGEDRCVRLSFATGMEQIEAGLDRLEKLLG